MPSGSLRPLVSDHFKVTKVDKECSLKVFCSNHGISANRFVIFLELGASEGKGEVRIRDVLLAKNEVLPHSTYITYRLSFINFKF